MLGELRWRMLKQMLWGEREVGLLMEGEEEGQFLGQIEEIK